MKTEAVKETLEGQLRELHLPTFRSSYEELARQAQQEAQLACHALLPLANSNYKQSLLELARFAVERSY